MSALLPITQDGAVIGIASPSDGRLRFGAVDPRLADLHGALFDSADAARHMAHAVLAARDLAPGVATGGAAASRLLRALLRQEERA